MVLKNNLFILLIILLFSSCREDGFVSPLYKNRTPLAAIKNLPIVSEQECLFSLNKDTWIQVYAAGEASIDMVNVDPVYLYKPDAVQVYIKQKNGKKLAFDFPLQDSLGSSSVVRYAINNVGFVAAYDKNQRLYHARVAIPFEVADIGGKAGEKALLNVVVADDDDYLKQKAKLAWIGNKDPLLIPEVSYGEVLLSKERTSAFVGTAQSLVSYAIPVGKRIEESNLPAVTIDNLIFGQINKAEDFSAKICSSWDPHALFLYLTILDNKEGRIDPKRIKTLSYFHDWGWIEDEKGNTVWKMTNFQTQHAGGALKNRKTDTEVFLKKGKYKLRYITDESHSWNNWDDEPPNLPFYGIELFIKSPY